MGAGKSTFARALIEKLGVVQPPEGSPTFAIAHEYRSKHSGSRGGREVVHIDFYRLKSEDEIEDAGIPAYFWERDGVVICEWLSMWPNFEASVLDAGATPEGTVNWRVSIALGESPELREVKIEKL
jgi:tRNA threonylcarbamoyl adenosine modification protein YjeE